MTDDLPIDKRVDYGTTVGRSFEDKLLLSLIDAHPEPGSFSEVTRQERREQRLRVAKIALFGEVSTAGRPAKSDERALRWMAEEQQRDKAKAAMIDRGNRHAELENFSPRSERDLARLAAERFVPGSHDVAERLRKKFSRVGARDYWFQVAKHHDDIPEQIEANALSAVIEILDRHGVPAKLAAHG